MKLIYHYIEKGGMRLSTLMLNSQGLSTSWEEVSLVPERAGKAGARCNNEENARLVAILVGGRIVQYEDDFMGPPTRIQP